MGGMHGLRIDLLQVRGSYRVATMWGSPSAIATQRVATIPAKSHMLPASTPCAERQALVVRSHWRNRVAQQVLTTFYQQRLRARNTLATSQPKPWRGQAWCAGMDRFPPPAKRGLPH
jgi:hypothetical protein